MLINFDRTRKVNRRKPHVNHFVLPQVSQNVVKIFLDVNYINDIFGYLEAEVDPIFMVYTPSIL